MAAAIVQKVHLTTYYGDLPAAVTSGNSVIVVAHMINNTTLTGVTFNGNAMTVIAGSYANSTSGFAIQVAYLHNITTGGTQTISSSTGGGVNALTVYEVSGLQNAAPDDAKANTGNSGTGTPGALTASVSNDFGVSGHECNGSHPTNHPSGWTLDYTYAAAWYADEATDLDVGAAGSKSATWTENGTVDWATTAVLFKITGATAGGAGQLLSTTRNHLIGSTLMGSTP